MSLQCAPAASDSNSLSNPHSGGPVNEDLPSSTSTRMASRASKNLNATRSQATAFAKVETRAGPAGGGLCSSSSLAVTGRGTAIALSATVTVTQARTEPRCLSFAGSVSLSRILALTSRTPGRRWRRLITLPCHQYRIGSVGILILAMA